MTTLWTQRAIWVLLFGLLLTACTDLAGEVEIVATITPSAAISADSGAAVTLPPAAPDLANGARIYQQNCTDCHGLTGAGDGELVESGEVPRMGSFRDPVHVRQQSVAFYYDIITNGNLVNLMPPWAESLSLQERWDVAMYVYMLHYSDDLIERGAALGTGLPDAIQLASDNDLAAATGLTGDDALAAVAYGRAQTVQNVDAVFAQAPVADAAPTATFDTVSFSGSVSNGTAGETVPDGMSVQLRYGSGELQAVGTTLDANNQFSFEGIPYDPTYQYFALVAHAGRGFVSELLFGDELAASNDVPITIYERLSDPTQIELQRVDFAIEVLPVEGLGTGLVVQQVNTYVNRSDRTFFLTPEGQNVFISVLMQLPVGAVILNTDNNQRYIQAQDDYALIDQQPVDPGEHITEAIYFLPYENGLIIDEPLNNRMADGTVSILVNAPGLSIRGEGYELVEEINLGSEDNPILAQRYEATLSLDAGDSLIFDIDGALFSSENTSDDQTVITGDNLLPLVLLGGLVIVVIGVGVIVGLRSRGSNPDAQIDKLLQEIADLESLHDAGRINHDAFQRKRQALKEQLAHLMSERDDA